MVSVEAFSELLDVLYSAPLDQDQWQTFLTLLGGHTQSAVSVFMCADTRYGLAIRAHGSGPEELFGLAARYNEQFGRDDPIRSAMLRNPRTGVLQGEEIVPFDVLRDTQMFRDLLAPIQARHLTVLSLTVTIRRMEGVVIWRTEDQGPMDDDSNRLLNLVFPHIQRALDIRQVLGVAQQSAAGAEALADASATATFLLTDRRHLVRANCAGEALLRAADGLVLTDGFLNPASTHAKRAFNNLLRDAALLHEEPSSAAPPRAIKLRRLSLKSPLQLLAIPAPLAARQHTGASVVLLVTDPDQAFQFPDDILRALFNLTPTEIEVANGLLLGMSVQECANVRRVTPDAIRYHVKRILAKTASSNHADLMRTLMTLPRHSGLVP